MIRAPRLALLALLSTAAVPSLALATSTVRVEFTNVASDTSAYGSVTNTSTNVVSASTLNVTGSTVTATPPAPSFGQYQGNHGFARIYPVAGAVICTSNGSTPTESNGIRISTQATAATLITISTGQVLSCIESQYQPPANATSSNPASNVSVNNFPGTQAVTGTVTTGAGSVTSATLAGPGASSSSPLFATVTNPTAAVTNYALESGGQLATIASNTSNSLKSGGDVVVTNQPSNPATSTLQQSEISALGSPLQAGGSIGNTSFGLTGNSNTAYVSSNHALLTDSSATTQPVSGTVTVANPTAAPTNYALEAGGTLSSISSNTSGLLKAGGSVTTASGSQTNATIVSTLPAFAATPTFNLGSGGLGSSSTPLYSQVINFPTTQPVSGTIAVSALPTSAATAANQTAEISVLGSPLQAGGNIGNTSFGLSGNGQLAYVSSNHALLTDGSATTQPISGSVTVGGTVTVSNLPSSLAGDGGALVHVTNFPTSSSSSSPSQSATGSAVPTSADFVGFSSSGNLVGVSAAQPLPVTVSNSPTTQNVNETQLNGVAASVGNGAADTGTRRVALATGASLTANLGSPVSDASPVQTSINGMTYSNGVLTATASGQNFIFARSGYASLDVSTGVNAATLAVSGSATATGTFTACPGRAVNNPGSAVESVSQAGASTSYQFDACGAFLQLATTSAPSSAQTFVPLLSSRPYLPREVALGSQLPAGANVVGGVLGQVGYNDTTAGAALASGATSTAVYHTPPTWASYYGCRAIASQAGTLNIMETLAGGTAVSVALTAMTANTIYDLSVRLRGSADTYACTVTNTNATSGTVTVVSSSTAN